MADVARLEQLRERARVALASHVPGTPAASDSQGAWSTGRLIEELQLYQAELEAQNDELRQAQQTANRALAQYSLLFQVLPLPALVIEPSGLIVQFNDQALSLFRLEQASPLRQHSLYRLLDADARDQLRAAVRRSEAGVVQRLPALRLAEPLQRAEQSGFLIHLSAQFHLDDHILVLFVDRGADLAREWQARKTQALLELRRLATALDEGSMLHSTGGALEQLTGASAWRIHRVGSGLSMPRLLARSSGASALDEWLDSLLPAAGIGPGERSIRVHASSDAGRAQLPGNTSAHFHAISVGSKASTLASDRIVFTLARARGPFNAEEQEGALSLSEELAYLLDHITNDRQLGRLSQALTQSVEGIFIADLFGVIQYVNPGFARLTGYEAADIIGKSTRVLSPEGKDADTHEAMWRAVKYEGLWQGEVINRRRDGSSAPHWLSLTTIRGLNGEPEEYMGALIDLSQRKADEEQIHRLAYFDPLTGLPNRRLLTERIRLALATRHRNGENGAVLFIDLDDFKRINDSLGHDVGDLLLQSVADQIQHCLREVDLVARLGGDEFVVLLDLPEKDLNEAAMAADHVAQKVALAISKPLELKGTTVNVTPSIGIAMLDEQSPTVQEVLKHADLAMYTAKSQGRNTVRFFNPAMQAEADARSSLEIELLMGVEHQQFELFFQPQCHANGRVIGYEALLRWHHPTQGLLEPTRFIALAEQTGLIVRIGQWVLRQAAERLAAWAQNEETRGLTLAVNVSARQFRDRDFLDQVVEILRETGAPANRLELELTESVLLHDMEDAVARMRQLCQLGIALSLDDFGTGYSSLAYLQQLPLCKLKIDRRFVQGVAEGSSNGSITRTIIGLARNIGLEVLAEGVEEQAQYDFLLRNGCALFQGYLFGFPVPLDGLPPALR